MRKRRRSLAAMNSFPGFHMAGGRMVLIEHRVGWRFAVGEL
jgi:hypothetical protein